jgi:hypothetical protein
MRSAWWVATCVACALHAPRARADDGADDDELALSDEHLKLFKRLSKPPGGYTRLMFTTAFGRGLRFNNPYRLEQQLGESAESLSLTASYWDSAVAIAFGAPDGLQHGAAVHLAVALHGVPQQAISGSYMASWRADPLWMLYARTGPVILTAPDPNVGGELAFGGALFFTGALGVTGELVGNLFYGAGTYEVKYSVIPTMSLQLGLIVDIEVLP